MSDFKKPKIYESPDGGLTVYARDIHDPVENRVQITWETSPKMRYNEITGWEESNVIDDVIHEDPLKQAINSNPYWLDIELCEEHPELKQKWEEYRELQKHYHAWDLLKK